MKLSTWMVIFVSVFLDTRKYVWPYGRMSLWLYVSADVHAIAFR